MLVVCFVNKTGINCINQLQSQLHHYVKERLADLGGLRNERMLNMTLTTNKCTNIIFSTKYYKKKRN